VELNCCTAGRPYEAQVNAGANSVSISDLLSFIIAPSGLWFLFVNIPLRSREKERNMMKRFLMALGALRIGLIVAPGHGYAQGTDIGKLEYRDSCASCHGEDGQGKGPVAGFLKQTVPDLTVLAKNNAGVFPFGRVYDVIDGRQAVAAHGPRDMQVWGSEYREEGEKRSGGYATPQELSSYARGRIIALIGYIYTLQTK
jgi:mono/diheme cytochrome c family protein